MECNKEEAVRAMEVAVKKLHESDFMGARKMAQLAQRLYPELENINRLLAVTEVHCSTENKISGLKYDCYGILQIPRTADQETIRKQYRKLALLLHPDKNKFVGAEDAFKLIGEANRLLTDQIKRVAYDMKLRASEKTDQRKPHQRQPNTKKPKKKKEAANSSQKVSQSQFGGVNPLELQAFWTACPFCNIRFQYLKTYVNRMLRCQSCCRGFIAHDLGNQNVPRGSSMSHPPNQHFSSDPVPSKVTSQSNENHSNVKSRDKRAEVNDTYNTGKTSDIGSGLRGEQKQKTMNVDMKGSKEGKTSRSGETNSKGQEVSEDAQKKRKRKSSVESDGGDLSRKQDMEFSKDTGRSYGACHENHNLSGQKKSGVNGDSYPRRSPRSKPYYYDKENSMNDFASQKMPKVVSKSSSDSKVEIIDSAEDIGVSKGNNFSSHTTVDGDGEEIKQQSPTPVKEDLANKKMKTGESKETMARTPVSDHSNTKTIKVDCDTTNTIVMPEPDFSDFDKDRGENLFSANQMWVVYDTKDGMPRFYCLIKKVLSPGFKLRITWLEPDPVTKEEIDWCDEEMPVACGKFRLGGTQNTSDILMFSHLKSNTLHKGRMYKIYPSKGETWALFKDWDIKWSSNSASHLQYKYDFLEVLSEFDEDAGIEVTYLCKVTGFVSLFQRGSYSFKIPPKELYRFSHQVPSYVMTGEESAGVPNGSFELDTAGLPPDILEHGSVRDVKLEGGGVASQVSSFSRTSPKNEAGSEKIEGTEKNDTDDSERESSMLRQTERVSQEIGMDQSSQVYGNHDMSEIAGCKGSNGNISLCKEKPKMEDKPRVETETVLRRSPRKLSKKCSGQNVKEFNDSDGIKGDNNGDLKKSSNFAEEREFSAKRPINSPSKFPGSKVLSIPIHDFNADKSRDKFNLNQIWAMYNDRDCMPTIYGRVMKIELYPNLRLHVALLEPLSHPADTTNQPCLGEFKVIDGKMKAFSPSSFSHRLSAELIGKDRYKIYPQKGEIWVLYKNLNFGPGKSEYDIVEVLENGDQATTAVILSRVKEYQSVYRCLRIQRSKSGIIDVPKHDLVRFSHQIPAFRHTGEIDKALSGCWELDSSAIPGSLSV